MADQCIVCLDDLNVADSIVTDDLHGAGATSIKEASTTHPETSTNQLPIARIKPCDHVLHDECVREWSQKANSCPICRQIFNVIEVLDKVGGIVLSEYEVENKKQVAEFDPSAFIEDEFEPEEDGTPCPVCGSVDDEDVLLLCDGCDAPYHTYCLGINDIPRGNWFCPECATDGAYARAAEEEQAIQHVSLPRGWNSRAAPRTQASARQSRERMRSDHWYGAWSVFSSRIHDVAGLDLDFLEEEQSMETYRRQQRRSDQEARQFRAWQTRLNIAGRQGARDVFRQAAPPGLPAPVVAAPIETREQSDAWGALEKAKELDTTSPRSRKRKSRSVTASPSEPPTEPQRKLKRPRTRRVLDGIESSSTTPIVASSSRRPNGRVPSPVSRPRRDTNGEPPSFLSTLLKEVEMAVSDDDTVRSTFSTASTSALTKATSPPFEYSSPASSPSPPSSSYHTPRAMSSTPPPHPTKRPGSPLCLSSRVEPNFQPADYSPNRSSREATPRRNRELSISPTLELQQPRPKRPRSSRSSHPVILPEATSPGRTAMSIEAKEGISNLVKAALSPHWKRSQITKEQYADINRDVSRKLYEIVADRNLPGEKEQSTWEKIAHSEVATAVKSLTAR